MAKKKAKVRFTDNGDGTVTDSTTGLTWQQRDDGERRTWAEAMDYAAALDLAGHQDRRLPTREELQSIVDYGRYAPAIDPVHFPDTASDYYWSSSDYADSTSYAWIINFGDGYVNSYNKVSLNYARCVRDIKGKRDGK